MNWQYLILKTWLLSLGFSRAAIPFMVPLQVLRGK